jgi:glycosyltransferase involved in cell wall biosynthesis
MKVSVLMITYNHEKFIEQAIESVLMQETNFDYELVIGEDCSTDHTREIVIDYQKRFPEKIRLLLPEANIGMHENFARTYKACKGLYIALLEGDDYWTSPYKLQKQADFLDAHAECSMCFHPVIWFYQEDPSIDSRLPANNSIWPSKYKKISTAEDLLENMYIQTGSVMLRSGPLMNYPVWLYEFGGADWALFILQAQHGKIGCLDEVMSAYRKHSSGVSYAFEEEKNYTEVIRWYDCINSHLKFKYNKTIKPIIADYCFKLAVIYDQKGNTKLARNWISRSIIAQLEGKQKPNFHSLKMLARLFSPAIYSFSKRFFKVVPNLLK